MPNDRQWWEREPRPLPPDIARALRLGGDPNVVLTPAQKAVLAQRQWEDEQEERQRAPVWTVGDLKATLEGLPEEMEVMLDLDADEGLAQWLRAVYTSDHMADCRRPVGPENRKTILTLSWQPVAPEEEDPACPQP
jgi:hypothetical protein